MAKDYTKGIINETFTTSTGTDVKSTSMLSGQAQDSLSGKNDTVAYSTSGTDKGPLGGLPIRK